MMFHREMELRRTGYVVGFVTLLCALAIATSEGRRKTIEMVLINADNCHFASSESETNKDKQACIKELVAEGEYEDDEFVPCIQKQDMDEAILTLPPDMKHDFFDCLRKKSKFPRDSEENLGLLGWFQKTIEYILGGHNINLRHTVRSSRHSLAELLERPATPAPTPSHSSDSSADSPLSSRQHAPVPTPSHSPAKPPTPSPNLHSPVEAPTPSPKLQPPVKTPAPSSKLRPPVEALTPSPKLSPPTEEAKGPPAPPADEEDNDDSDSPDSKSPIVVRSPPRQRASSKNEEESPMAIVAGIVAVGVGIVLIVALFLFCGSDKKRQVDPKGGPKDDKPLLVSLSEISSGSSQKSNSLGNSATKQFGVDNGKEPHLVNPENGTFVTENPTSDGKSSATLPLNLPPGRSDSQSPPLPPPVAPPPPAPKAPPPPPPKVARPPPAPPAGNSKAAPAAPQRHGPNGSSMDEDSGSHKTKLKPFFWDKVLANPGQSMVWHEISAGSFQFNEEMMESLFGYAATETNKGNRKKDSETGVQYIKIIDPRKAQNLSILLRALNVTTAEVVDAIEEGNSELPGELMQTLLKMAPTSEEELKLRLYSGDLSLIGPAERFLKVLVDIPFAFKRLECLLFMHSMSEEVTNIKESFVTLEVASKKLRENRLFLKLLEAVLKTGNRMNDGTYRGGAQAFKLDTLLKLADVKGTDGKTSLLHFVVQEIIRSEGIRAARTERESRSSSSIISSDTAFDDIGDDSAEHHRELGLQVVTGLSTELQDVKRAATIDLDGLSKTISKLGQSLNKTKGFISAEMNHLDDDGPFNQSLSKFLENAETDISWIAVEEKRIMAQVKSAADYFHGKSGRDEGSRLFTIVRDFLIVLEKTCKQVKETAEAAEKQAKNSKKENQQPQSATCKQNSDVRRRLFPAIVERRRDEESSSSDEEDGGDGDGDGDGDGESSSSSS